ncbi:MAG: ATP-binding protein [Burkholderiaceae bacterium]|nr:ATP-binding protein [Burkholderiaceae bacterium]
MSQYFARADLASQMARQLLHPGILDEGLRSGLFISGQRRTGKTTFLLRDLIPALEAQGALVMYVDLWSDIKANPAQLVRTAIIEALKDLQNPASALLARFGRIRQLDLAAGPFKFGFKVEAVGAPDGATLAQAMTELVDQARCNVVMVVDEVQQAITTDEGNELLLALKAARDAVNPRPGTPGHFIFLGTGSHRALVSELTTRRTQAFNGATSIPYPVLAADYVDYLLQRLAASGAPHRPSRKAAIDAFNALGNRPEELLRALRQLQAAHPADDSTDAALSIIAMTLRSTAADLELSKVEQLGVLATAIFERIAATEGDATGLFSNETAADYSQVVGRNVNVEDIQPVVNELMAANLVMRRGHGRYAITDPFVQAAWREKKALLQLAG